MEKLVTANSPCPRRASVWAASGLGADPLFFVQEPGRDSATARLLWVPSGPPQLRKATGELTYEIGRDFTWQPGEREIVLTPRSRIPYRTQVLLPPGSPDSIAASRDGKKHLLFGEGHFFHDQQVSAAYETAERSTGPAPEVDASGLARVGARLQPRRMALQASRPVSTPREWSGRHRDRWVFLISSWMASASASADP